MPVIHAEHRGAWVNEASNSYLLQKKPKAGTEMLGCMARIMEGSYVQFTRPTTIQIDRPVSNVGKSQEESVRTLLARYELLQGRIWSTLDMPNTHGTRSNSSAYLTGNGVKSDC